MIEILLIAFLLVILAALSRAYIIKRAESSFLRSSKQKLSTEYGLASEKFMPFMKEYPYQPKDFRFIGTPVDGVQFNEDGIVFVEFKTSKSRQSKRQKNIEKLVKEGKVSFMEFRI